MSYNPKQSSNKTPLGYVPSDGYEEIDTLFGLKVRVKKGTIQDHEIVMLQNLNRCLFAVGYEKVLQVTSNFEILSFLRNSLKKDYYTNQKNVGQNKASEDNKTKGEKKGNQQNKGPIYERKYEKNNQQNCDNVEEQKQGFLSKTSKELIESQAQRNQRNSEQVNKQDNNLRQQQQTQPQQYNNYVKQSQQEHQWQTHSWYRDQQHEHLQRTSGQIITPQQQKQQEQAKKEISSNVKSQPLQYSQPMEHKPSSVTPQLGQKFSRLEGWFFVDRKEEISSAHSLQNNVSEKKYWNILSSIWDQIPTMKNQGSLRDLQLTQEAMNIEQHQLKSTQAFLSKCNFWMTKTPYILSTTPLETIDSSTIQSQQAIYKSFDLRAIFTQSDNTNCLRSLIFGLLYNTLAFEKPYTTISEIMHSSESVTIKLVILHILIMQAQQKLSTMQIAVNLSLLFRFNQFSNSLLRFFIKQLPKGCDLSDSEKVIQAFAAKFNCVVVFQNVSPLGSMVKMANSSQQKDNVIFLDLTQKGCAINLYFQEEKLNSCMSIYREKLGSKFILPSI